jgi:hypothetical protein
MTERYVIHLPVVAADLTAAQRLARVVARWTVMLPQTDPGETTVSAEDNQNVRHRVFCDLLMPGRRRCMLRADPLRPLRPPPAPLTRPRDAGPAIRGRLTVDQLPLPIIEISKRPPSGGPCRFARSG